MALAFPDGNCESNTVFGILKREEGAVSVCVYASQARKNTRAFPHRNRLTLRTLTEHERERERERKPTTGSIFVTKESSRLER